MTTFSENPGDLLAVNGGSPVRSEPMPMRKALGQSEVDAVKDLLEIYSKSGADPGYQGWAERRYTDEFVRQMGGGYADAVSTGTSALYICIAALGLKPGSEVLVSPITDPGTLSAIVLNGLVPRLLDTAPNSYNVDVKRFLERINSNVKAVIIVHSLGRAVDIAPIIEVAREKKILIIEDCSQSHGARINNASVGTFGDLSAFSTMYRKIHITGGSGGVVYSKNLDLFQRAIAHADRGKPRWLPDFDDRNPNLFLFPALNFHTDEISCAIGYASLKRLRETILRRLIFVAELTGKLKDHSGVCQAYGYTPDDSPFVCPIIVDLERIKCSKSEFAEAIKAEGIGLNSHYQYLAADWPWLKKYLSDEFMCPNARSILSRSFMLYLNEKYNKHEVADCLKAIVKVERHFRCN